MKLVVGGCSQGKLDYVLDESAVQDFYIADSELPNAEQLQWAEDKGKTVIVNHFHAWMRAGIRQGKNAEQEILDFIKNVPDSIVISDEIGNGIVPLLYSRSNILKERISSLSSLTAIPINASRTSSSYNS